jgi:quercetin dioxygenase-like cupin family protein
MPAAVTTQTATVKTIWSLIFRQALPNLEGKTFTSVIMEFPPSAGAAPHRHGAAFVWAYVLAGAIRIKLNDEPIRTCREGESWFEEPSTHHLLAENNSTTEPAKLLAVFISNPGDPLKVDDDGIQTRWESAQPDHLASGSA